MSNRLFLGVVILCGGLLAIGAGCGGASAADVCQHLCDCDATCSPASEAACEREGNAGEATAERLGCSAQLEAYDACRVDLGCRPSASACERQTSALNACLSGHASGHGGHDGGGSGSGGGHPGASTTHASTTHAASTTTTGSHMGGGLRCSEGAGACWCTDEQLEGYDQATCHGTYSCCSATNADAGFNECACASDSRCDVLPDWHRVDSCP